MSRRTASIGPAILLALGVVTSCGEPAKTDPPAAPPAAPTPAPVPPTASSTDPTTIAMTQSDPQIRRALFDAVQPVRINNCTLARFGEMNDGGYLMCGNLLGEVEAAYSYGIDGYDGWGCQVSNTLKIPVHQYDCFNTTLPKCVAETTFHTECVGPTTEVVEGRAFDTVKGQVERNGHARDRIVMKMDIEGAEWDTLLAVPDSVLANVDQLAIEFHRINEDRFVRVIERLKQTFYVAHLHFNNHVCYPGLDPFPSWAFEVLLVNKRIAQVDTPPVPVRGPHPLDAPSANGVPDCQTLSR